MGVGRKKSNKVLAWSLAVIMGIMAVFQVPPVLERATAAEIPVIRVAVVTGAPSLTVQVVQGEYLLVDGSTNLRVGKVASGKAWKITPEGTSLKVSGPEGDKSSDFNGVYQGPLVLRPADTAKAIFSVNGKRYRGSLTLLNQEGSLLAVNILDIEKYLYGVVGPEMGAAPDEALKAQAVVSRTYVLNYIGSSPHYDVGPTTVNQVYQGYDGEEPRVTRAVDATAGQVILYDGKIIQAYFHANSGGYTEDSENVWYQSLPYLRATPAPEDAYAATLAGYPASTYEWREEFTRRDVEAKLISRGIQVGNLMDIRVSNTQRNRMEPTRSGRATQLDLVGDQDTYSVYRDSIRGILGKNGSLKSTLFDMTLDSTVTILDAGGNKSEVSYGGDLYALGADGSVSKLNGAAPNYEVLGRGGEARTMPKVFEKVVVSGKGYGHGLGMSQWGARGMAEAGKTYKDIIEHYYNQDLCNGRLRIASNYGK